MTVAKLKSVSEPRGSSRTRGRSIHLIEAQALFVPALVEVFAELGLDLLGVSGDVDLHGMLETQPDVVFVDADYVNQEPLHLVSLLRTLVPEGAICVYTSERNPRWAAACHAAGATAVLSKNARRGEVVAGLRDAVYHRTYTDVRLRDTGA